MSDHDAERAMTPQEWPPLQEAEVMNAARFSGSEALFFGHSRGVDVGIAEVKQGQMLWVSVSSPMGIWLAALKRGGWSGLGRVVVWLAAAANATT